MTEDLEFEEPSKSDAKIIGSKELPKGEYLLKFNGTVDFKNKSGQDKRYHSFDRVDRKGKSLGEPLNIWDVQVLQDQLNESGIKPNDFCKMTFQGKVKNKYFGYVIVPAKKKTI